MTIYAAGAVCWREDSGKLLVALVNRARYDDWSWPKGKVDPGETLLETAVREIAEETGLHVRLGRKLSVISYPLDSGDTKEVHYWAARVSDKAIRRSKFKPNEEVAAIKWLTEAEARKKLSYAHDVEILDEVVRYHREKELRTKPFIVLRHASATPRSEWTGEDGRRPLLAEGKAQAKYLVPMLAAFGPKLVVSSPWTRCRTTVEPYAKYAKRAVVERSQLSERGNKKGPKRTRKVIQSLTAKQNSVLICSHRPALPSVFEALSNFIADKVIRGQVLDASLKPGEFKVFHFVQDTSGKRRVVAAESYGPPSQKAN